MDVDGADVKHTSQDERCGDTSAACTALSFVGDAHASEAVMQITEVHGACCVHRPAVPQFVRLLERAWQYKGCICRGLSWDRWTLDELKMFALCIGGSALAGTYVTIMLASSLAVQFS